MNRIKHYQRTLNTSVSFVGLGLHSGVKSRITLRPCEDGSGIFFRRKDVPSQRALISARWYKVTDTTLSTLLSNSFGSSIATVEHLMAALRICQIDNLEIEVDGPEIPIMDGSSKSFVDTLLSIGSHYTKTLQKVICIHKTVEVRNGDQYALLLPDTEPRVTVSIAFKQAAIGAQTLSINLNADQLHQAIAPARTFGFLNQIENLQKQGLALGGSLNNAILVDNDKVVNEEGLRFHDEFVRHKILHAIGDLALIGFPIMGHYHAYKGGHQINKQLISKLIEDKSAWSLLSLDEFYQLHGEDSKQYSNASKNKKTLCHSNIKYQAAHLGG